MSEHIFSLTGGAGLPTQSFDPPVSTPEPVREVAFAEPHTEYRGGYGAGSLKSLQAYKPHNVPFDFLHIDNDVDAAKKSYGGGYGMQAGYGMWAGALLAGLRANAPGAWSADRLRQAQHFVGIAFTAISAMCDGVSSAALEVTDMDMEKEIQSHINVQKAVSHTERKGIRVPYDHELVELFEDPNPHDTFKDLLYKTTLQLCLTGNCITWMVPNRLALPSELYVIPTALAYPVPYSQAWPRGAWRLTPLYPYGPFAILPTPVATAGAVVPADDVLHLKLPHPLLTWDGYSPLTAGARQIDIMEMMDDSRWAAMDGGINPSMVFTVDPEKSGVNFNQDALDNFQKRLVEKYAASKNFGKGMVLPPGVDINPYSNKPVEMAFEGGWEQMRDYILSLWRVPKGVVGITESSSYAALYASLKQFALIGLKPMAEFIAQHWTKRLAKKFDRALRISLPLPTLDDPHLLEEQLKTDAQIGVRTKGEWRAMRGLPLFGDERDDELVGGQEGLSEQLPGDNASKVNPKDKPGSAPVSERRDEADDARPNNTAGLHSLPGMGGKKSMPPPEPPRLHKYSSTQFDLPDDVATRIKAIGLRIREEELGGEGRESLPHVTLKYGLLTDNAENVAEIVRGFGPITITLGKTSVFYADAILASVASPGTPVQVQRGGAEFDVLKVDVHSDRLIELNRLISDSFPHYDSHPKYSPHATICYLRPGVGANYMGSTELMGTEITFNSFTFSDRDGRKTFIPIALPSRVKSLSPSLNGKHLSVVAQREKEIQAIDDLTPPPSMPKRPVPLRRKTPNRISRNNRLSTLYPPPDPKPYPDPNLSPPANTPGPPPEINAAAANSIWWHPPEFEWRLFQQWADALPPDYPTLHNLSEYGWARGPKIVSTELLSATGAFPVISSELRMAILALIRICEETDGEVSVYVQPETGQNPGRALVTDMKSMPTNLKTVKDDSGHEHDSADGKFSATDSSADAKRDPPAGSQIAQESVSDGSPVETSEDVKEEPKSPAKSQSATDTATKEFSSISSDLSSENPNHEHLLSRVDSLVESTIDAIPHEIDTFEDAHIEKFTAQFGEPVFKAGLNTVFDDFVSSIREEAKALALATTEYGDAVANAISEHAETGEFDSESLAAAEKTYKKALLSSRMDLRSYVRDAEKGYAAAAAELEDEWTSVASQAAEQMMSDVYDNDLESAVEDSKIYNQELEKSGNPYRIMLDDSDPNSPQWGYGIPEVETTERVEKSLNTPSFLSWQKSLKRKSQGFIRRVPPALFSAGGIVPPPADLAAAINNMATALPSKIAELIANGRRAPRRIEVERNEDGTHKAYIEKEAT